MSHSPVIAHLLYPGSFGGAESVVRSLAVGRAAAGRPTHLLAGYRNDADNPLFGALRSGGVHVTPFRSRGRHYAGEIGAVARLLRELGIELLHTHVYRSDFLGYGAARRAGIPVVSTFHGETGGSPANRFYEWSVKRLFRRFDGVICVSEANRRKLRKARSDGPNVWVVPNGVAPARLRDRADARLLLNLAEDATAIGWVGRLSHEKGPDLFLETLRRLDRSDVCAVIIGDGPEREGLETRSRPSGPALHFAGGVPDAASLLPAFDLVVLSSRDEGLPLVLLEAFQAGVPVAAFTVGGIPELLTPATGWPVQPGDIDGLTRAVAAALEDPLERRARATAATALLNTRHGIEAWVDSVERVYDAVLASAKSGAVGVAAS